MSETAEDSMKIDRAGRRDPRETRVGAAQDRSPMDPTLLVVAGEASGDQHGGALVEEIRRLCPGARLFGVGGDRMETAGVELLVHERRLAVVGITEVLSHLGDVRKALRSLVDEAVAREVDGVVLIDYPDFNMTLARRLEKVRPATPVVYYVSPQVWAWRSGRIRTIARLVDRMLVILPFEEALYREAGVPVDFVGHPLLDEAVEPGDRDGFAERHGLDPGDDWVGLLPGSRRLEVRRLLPPMLDAAARSMCRGRRFLVAVAPSVDRDLYTSRIEALPPGLRRRVRLVDEGYAGVIRHARAAVVCSGTATLETAAAGTPLVVVYRTSWLTYNLGRLLVRIPDIALVNVVAGCRIVPELLQGEVTGKRIAEELAPLLDDGTTRGNMLADLRSVRERLGTPGVSSRAARIVLEVVGGAAGDPVDAPDEGSPR